MSKGEDERRKAGRSLGEGRGGAGSRVGRGGRSGARGVASAGHAPLACGLASCPWAEGTPRHSGGCDEGGMSQYLTNTRSETCHGTSVGPRSSNTRRPALPTPVRGLVGRQDCWSTSQHACLPGGEQGTAFPLMLGKRHPLAGQQCAQL